MNERRHKGIENLIPIASRPPEEQFAIRSRGGKNAQKANIQRKTAQEAMQALLSCELDRSRLRELYGEAADLLPEKATVLDALSLAQVREAGQGNSKAYEVVRDTAGYKPVEQVRAEVNTLTENDRELLEKVARRMRINEEN